MSKRKQKILSISKDLIGLCGSFVPVVIFLVVIGHNFKEIVALSIFLFFIFTISLIISFVLRFKDDENDNNDDSEKKI